MIYSFNEVKMLMCRLSNWMDDILMCISFYNPLNLYHLIHSIHSIHPIHPSIHPSFSEKNSDCAILVHNTVDYFASDNFSLLSLSCSRYVCQIDAVLFIVWSIYDVENSISCCQLNSKKHVNYSHTLTYTHA